MADGRWQDVKWNGQDRTDRQTTASSPTALWSVLDSCAGANASISATTTTTFQRISAFPSAYTFDLASISAGSDAEQPEPGISTTSIIFESADDTQL
jgi:hypothetical protein